MACRSARERFVNGQIEQVGYLTDLRIDPRFRGRRVGLRLFGLLEQLHADGRVKRYVAVVADQNSRVRELLRQRPRSAIPLFQPIGQLWTYGLVLRRSRASAASHWQLELGTPELAEEIAEYLNRCAATRQLAPVYRAEDLLPGTAATPGLRIEDFVLARQAGQIGRAHV